MLVQVALAVAAAPVVTELVLAEAAEVAAPVAQVVTELVAQAARPDRCATELRRSRAVPTAASSSRHRAGSSRTESGLGRSRARPATGLSSTSFLRRLRGFRCTTECVFPMLRLT